MVTTVTALRSHYIFQITEEARKYPSSGAAEYGRRFLLLFSTWLGNRTEMRRPAAAIRTDFFRVE